jgi:hypothetical protein
MEADQGKSCENPSSPTRRSNINRTLGSAESGLLDALEHLEAGMN